MTDEEIEASMKLNRVIMNKTMKRNGDIVEKEHQMKQSARGSRLVKNKAVGALW